MMNHTSRPVRADLEPTNGLIIDESFADLIILRSNGQPVAGVLVPIEWNGRRVTEAAHELAAANGLTIIGWGC